MIQQAGSGPHSSLSIAQLVAAGVVFWDNPPTNNSLSIPENGLFQLLGPGGESAQFTFDGNSLLIQNGIGDDLTIDFSSALSVNISTLFISGDIAVVGLGTKIGLDQTHKLSMFGAVPIVQPNVTGSRATGVALTNLLIALANFGMINNATTT